MAPKAMKAAMKATTTKQVTTSTKKAVGATVAARHQRGDSGVSGASGGTGATTTAPPGWTPVEGWAKTGKYVLNIMVWNKYPLNKPYRAAPRPPGAEDDDDDHGGHHGDTVRSEAGKAGKAGKAVKAGKAGKARKAKK